MRTVIEKHESGQRLDAVLARLVPGMGLRGRRRLCEQGLVHVQDRPAIPAYRVLAGQEVRILPVEPEPVPHGHAALRMIARNAHWAAVYKPAGLHSVGQVGSPSPSLEGFLPALFAPEPGIQEWHLLNRLDQPTSGLVMVALNPEGQSLWQRAQNEGTVRKHYVALVHGAWPHGYGPESSLTLRRAMHGRTNRVVAKAFDSTDPRRFTKVCGLLPLAPIASPNSFTDPPLTEALSLVGATIIKGGRHQIRAHLALFGHPLWGDTLYGGQALPANNAPSGFYLHHGAISLPGFEATCPCTWALPWENVKTVANGWFGITA